MATGYASMGEYRPVQWLLAERDWFESAQPAAPSSAEGLASARLSENSVQKMASGRFATRRLRDFAALSCTGHPSFDLGKVRRRSTAQDAFAFFAGDDVL